MSALVITPMNEPVAVEHGKDLDVGGVHGPHGVFEAPVGSGGGPVVVEHLGDLRRRARSRASARGGRRC